MAGNANSGGFRPTAPQNNTGVSATGGAGSADGVPNLNYSGFAYGENKAINEQQGVGLPMGQPTTVGSTPAPTGLPEVTPITAPSETPERDVYYGMPIGDGPNSIPLPQGMSLQEDPAKQIIRALYQQNPRNEDLRYIVEAMDAQEQVQ